MRVCLYRVPSAAELAAAGVHMVNVSRVFCLYVCMCVGGESESGA